MCIHTRTYTHAVCIHIYIYIYILSARLFVRGHPNQIEFSYPVFVPAFIPQFSYPCKGV